MEYKKEFKDIEFRVIFSTNKLPKNTLTFAAHPYEMMFGNKLSKNPDIFLMYGKIDLEEKLEIGFKGFTFEMTQEFHDRLGVLYQHIRAEHKAIILKVV